MTVVPIVLSIMAGICLFAGGIHLLFGLSRRPRDWVHITFALASLAIAGNALAVLAIHSADSVDAYVAAFKYGFGPTALGAQLSILWFVAFYTGVRPRRFLLALSLWFTGIVVLQLVLPYGILFAGVSGLREIALPWGEQFVVGQTTTHPWRWVVDLYLLCHFAFLLYATYRQYRRGDRGRARLLAGAILLFFLTAMFDGLVDTGVVNSIYIGELAYLGFVVAMSVRLNSEIIQTEAELGRYRTKLEAMVDERTLELTQANDQLAREVGERSQAEETLHQRVEELAVLGRITQSLATVTDLPLALEQIGEAIVLLFDARHTYVILPAAEDPQLRVLAGFERESGPIGAAPLPVSLDETPYFRRVLDQAESLTITDVQALPQVAPMRDPIARQQIRSAMLVPLLVRGTAIGLLVIATDRDDLSFSSGKVRLAETIAGDVASAIENARLFEQAQLVAVSEERSRLARDLHDSVTQVLFSINLIALSLGRLWKRNPELAARTTDELQRLTRGALAEMRTLLRELRPGTIAATELSTLLKQLSDGVSARHDIPVDVEVGQLCDIPPEVHVALYRIAQEALSNITKHAEASQVTVKLVCEDTAVQLTVTDDGQGFDPDDVPAEHMGLAIMRERVETIGAALTIISRPGAGTSIVVAWPAP